MSRKGQIALEFMSLTIIGLILALVILVGFVVVLQDTLEDRKAAEIKDLGFQIQRELILASEVHEGYSRDIDIPEYIGKYDYTIINNERVLILTVDDVDYPFPIPKTNGTIKKGTNTIKNIGGEVVIE
ncbi:MAG: hypothetical protein ISS25_04400 [Nanoarchaeota archaeon]|nr:hypothetical protein [DPANN group archaeon]MBL7117042.1 hypothetical protein [Nanoarchaeota archaeon]